MDKNRFWEIIDEVNAEVDYNNQKSVLEATQRKLMQLSSEEILDWYSIQKAYKDLAYRNDLWAACAATRSHCSDDGFIDFRSWLISRGHEVYVKALQDSDSLAELDFEAGTADFESYGYVASDAYAQKAALDQGGEEGVKQKYDAWLSKNRKQLMRYFKKYPQPCESIDQRLKSHFLSYLREEYDIYQAVDHHPLREELAGKIKTEIQLKPDVSLFCGLSDLKRLTPRLYEKFVKGSYMESSEGR